MYKVHLRIHVGIRGRIRIQIHENKRKNLYANFKKFVHEF